MAETADSGLRWFARRASGDAFFLGSALADYQAMHGIDNQQLAGILQCSKDSLARLALCRRPDDQGASFREEVQCIASFASCNADGLLKLLREVATVAALREARSVVSSPGMLMAARDRTSNSEPPKRTAVDKKRSKREPKE